MGYFTGGITQLAGLSLPVNISRCTAIVGHHVACVVPGFEKDNPLDPFTANWLSFLPRWGLIILPFLPVLYRMHSEMASPYSEFDIRSMFARRGLSSRLFGRRELTNHGEVGDVGGESGGRRGRGTDSTLWSVKYPDLLQAVYDDDKKHHLGPPRSRCPRWYYLEWLVYNIQYFCCCRKNKDRSHPYLHMGGPHPYKPRTSDPHIERILQVRECTEGYSKFLLLTLQNSSYILAELFVYHNSPTILTLNEFSRRSSTQTSFSSTPSGTRLAMPRMVAVVIWIGTGTSRKNASKWHRRKAPPWPALGRLPRGTRRGSGCPTRRPRRARKRMKGTKPESPQACAWSGGTRASVSSERTAIFRIDPSGKVLVAKGEKGTWQPGFNAHRCVHYGTTLQACGFG